MVASTGSAARVAGSLINAAGSTTTATVKRAVSWSNAAQKVMKSTAKTRKTLESIVAAASDVMAVMSVPQVHNQDQGGATAAAEDEEDEQGQGSFQTPSEGESNESDASD